MTGDAQGNGCQGGQCGQGGHWTEHGYQGGQPYCDKIKIFSSRPMRKSDTSAFKKMFQCPSLVERPFDQCEIATH